MMIRAYRALLALYPRRLRREDAPELLRLYRHQLRELRRQGRPTSAFVRRALLDLMQDVLRERAAQITSPFLMLRRNPVARWRFWVSAFIRDLRYGARVLWKTPGMTLVAVITLALGIGANAAIFSLLDAVVLRPLPYADPDQIVTLWEKRLPEGTFDNVVAPADYKDWAAQATSFSTIAAEAASTRDLSVNGIPERVLIGAATAHLFDVFQVQPVHGRVFRAGEDEVGRHRIVVMSNGLWQRRYGADPSLVGRTIDLSGVAHEIVGILPPAFEFPGEPRELWVPMPLGGEQPRASHFLTVYARLKPGVTLEEARAEMDRIGAVLATQYPETNRDHAPHVRPLEDYLRGPVRTGVWILTGAVAFVLLIACVNVSNMLLARAASRRREMAVRAAVGAGRARLAGQALTESLLLSAVGTVAGLGVAALAIRALPALLSAREPIFGLDAVSLNGRTVVFAALSCVITGLVFGLLPAWHASHDDPNDGLKGGGRSAGGLRRKLRVALVGVEIALASLLLVGAGISLRSFAGVLAQPTGFESADRLTFEIALPAARYKDDAAVRNRMSEIELRLEALPGVRGVASSVFFPLTGAEARSGISVEGSVPVEGEGPRRAHYRPVSHDYFGTMGITLVRGRAFARTDDERGPPVAIVNQALADRYWPAGSAVGARVLRNGTDTWLTIVGISANVRAWGPEQPVNPELYVPLAQQPFRFTTFVLHTQGDPLALLPAVRQTIREVDPALPVSRVRTLEELVAAATAARRSTTVLLGSFAVVALVLAVVGVYGVMAHVMAMRTGEIAVRMTLGAAPGDVLTSVMREGLAVAVGGLATGFAASLALLEVLRTVAFGIEPLDLVTYGAVGLVLTTSTLAACWVPARRAMRVDPAVSLRRA
jgi:putative ABC transport system permease protein